MSKVRISVEDGVAGLSLETATEDDFFYFRDGLHYALEPGGFGSRFPVFQKKFPDDAWELSELPALERELETMAEELKGLPPKPLDCNWSGKLASSGRRCASLYEVYVDSRGRPLVGTILELCRAARRTGRPLRIE